MPSKSRKNRRYSPQAKRATIAPAAVDSTNVQAAAIPAAPVVSSYKTKGTVDTLTTTTLLSHELKWISLVTAIIIVLLIASYFVFR